MITRFKNNQKGAALLVSLILLIVLTLYGLSASNISVMQVQMTATNNDSQLALSAAEAAASAAIIEIETLETYDDISATDFYFKGDSAFDLSDETKWQGDSRIKSLTNGAISAANQSADYFVVYLGVIKEGDGSGSSNSHAQRAEKYRKRSPQLGDREIDGALGGSGNAVDSHGYLTKNTLYKIVARGTGADVEGNRMIESYYQRTLKIKPEDTEK